MCLLFVKPADVTFTDEWLRDFYSRNQDGYGVMYVSGGKVCYDKELGKVDDWVKFYRKHEHRAAAFHLRMRTHGDIDLENCHPYVVSGFNDFGAEEAPILLMHNGVIPTGNAKDTSKSDTWHYVRDYLRPIVTETPEAIHTKWFNELVGKHIGNSRFALIDSTGNIVVVNKSQGVEWNGAWFSNTYAWSANKALPPKLPTEWKGYEDFYYGKKSWRKEATKTATPKKAKTDNVTPLPAPRDTTGNEIQAMADEILYTDPDLYESVTFQKLNRLYLDLGHRAAWDWIEMLSFGEIDRKEFLQGLDNPKDIRQIKELVRLRNRTKGAQYVA